VCLGGGGGRRRRAGYLCGGFARRDKSFHAP
jgi:hypothetical protein